MALLSTALVFPFLFSVCFMYHVFFFLVYGDRRKPEMMQSPMVPLSMPQKLHFNITPEIKKDIEEANEKMNLWGHILSFYNDNFYFMYMHILNIMRRIDGPVLTVLTFLPTQTGWRLGYEGRGIWPLWEKCSKIPQDEPWCFHTDSAPTGLLQVICWCEVWRWVVFFLKQGSLEHFI